MLQPNAQTRRGGRQHRGASAGCGGSLAAVGLLGMGTVQAVAQLAHEEETIVRRLDGADVRTVDIDNGAGSVRVVGTPGDEVTIRARVSHGLRSTGHDERLEGDRLVLDASCPLFASNFCSVSYTVEVPQGVSVRIHAEASIRVADIAGDVVADTSNGRIQADRIGGDVRLDSANGRVVGTDLESATAHAASDNGAVELEFLEPPRTVVADSDNGSVEVVLPDTPDDYILDTSSDNGGLFRMPRRRRDPDSERTVTASSDNGDVTVRYAPRR